MKQGIHQQFIRALNVVILVAAGMALGLNSTVAASGSITPPSGLVAWWKGEGSANDTIGTNNGIVSSGLTFTSGKVGQSFLMNSTNAYFHVPASPSLNVGLSSGFTVEAWIKPSNVNGLQPLAEWNNEISQALGVIFCIGANPSNQGALATAFSDTNGANFIIVTSPNGTLTAGVWQHVALTYDRATHMIRLYVNGGVVAQSAWSGDVPQTSYNLWVGRRPEDCGGGCSTDGTYLTGPMDELSLYNRALATNEIAAIYAARGAGKCPLPPTVVSVTPPSHYVNEGATVAYTATAVGSPTLTYQWQHNGADLAGATNATIVLSNVVYAQAGNYAVVVSNPGGITTSSNVLLRVNRAPIADASASESLVISPNGTNAAVVFDGSRSSDPDGDALTYAWFITGDTNPFATSVVAVKSLPMGTNQLVLAVNDGMASGSQCFMAEVITTAQAVGRLVEHCKAGSVNTRPLIASLRAALASIKRSQPGVAVNQLQAFIKKVQAQLKSSDPVLAAQLIADAQAIIDALNGGSGVVVTQTEIASISSKVNGKSHLKIKGVSNRVYVIETSTNMVDWVPVGVATQAEDGSYEFDDTQTPSAGMRFYRVMSPK
jgi:hypothetical protein